jgi:hypothetical protein
MPHLPSEIPEHYRRIDEGARITTGYGQLEVVRTQEIVRRHLPAGPETEPSLQSLSAHMIAVTRTPPERARSAQVSRVSALVRAGSRPLDRSSAVTGMW